MLRVDGMMCGACEAHVANAVRNAAKVKSVKASHTKGKVEIVLEDCAEIDKIIAAIKGEGYEVLEQEELPYEKQSGFAKFFKKK